jgi:hypothetical protein
MRVMIGCPLQNRSWILPEYLKRIENLVMGEDTIHLAFLVNNSIDDTECILKAYQEEKGHLYDKVTIQEYTDFDYEDDRQNRDTAKIAEIKNAWLGMRSKKDDFVMMVDSDVLIPRRSWLDLFSVGSDVTAGLYSTGNIAGMRFYNIFGVAHDTYIHVREFEPPEGDRWPVLHVKSANGFLLFSKKVLNEPTVEFGYHKQDEAIYLCERIREIVDEDEEPIYDILCDTSCQAEHVMSKDDLNPTQHYIH